MVFHQMLCGILANKIINKIIKSVFKLEIQIFLKNHPFPPPTPTPTIVKGKVQQLCTQYRTFRPKIPSAAYDLAPQTERATVCLAFCINPSSLSFAHITCSTERKSNLFGAGPPILASMATRLQY